jgi:copper chaperone CopZ
MVMKERDMRNIIIATLLVLATPLAASAETITANVNGMVCGFCAKAIQKSFQKSKAVDKVNVDLDKKVVVVVLKSNATLADAAVTKTIVDAGYTVTKIARTL